MFADKLVFLDETATWLGMTRAYGWSQRGHEVRITRAGGKQHVSLSGAIALDGCRGAMTSEGSVGGGGFHAYRPPGLVPHPNPGAHTAALSDVRTNRDTGSPTIAYTYADSDDDANTRGD